MIFMYIYICLRRSDEMKRPEVQDFPVLRLLTDAGLGSTIFGGNQLSELWGRRQLEGTMALMIHESQ